MSQQMDGKRQHSGWRQEETDLMWSEVERAQEGRATLREAFERIASRTGRKPNSVRNYYYAALREREGEKRTLSFVPFNDIEVRELIKTVLEARGRGESVRACVTRLAEGDRSKMLRYQNKYRSVLKNRKELILEINADIAAEGKPTFDPYMARGIRHLHIAPESGGDEAEELARDIVTLPEGRAALETIRALTRLARRGAGSKRTLLDNDRMAVRMDLLRLELVKRDEALIEVKRRAEAALGALNRVQDLLSINRELLGLPEEKRAEELSAQAETLRGMVSQLENDISIIS